MYRSVTFKIGEEQLELSSIRLDPITYIMKDKKVKSYFLWFPISYEDEKKSEL